MRLKSLVIIIVSGFFCLCSLVMTPEALALTQVKLSDIQYQDCPPELAEGNVTSWGSTSPADCFLVIGKANNTSGKTVYDADVFGRIYDANNNPVIQNRSRIGSIDEIPPGISNFSVRISVPADQAQPFKLKNFKSSGFSSPVIPQF